MPDYPPIGRGQGHVTFLNFTPSEITLQWLQLETSNFVRKLATWNISLLWLTVPQVGVVGITWHIFSTPFEIFLQGVQMETSNFVYYLAEWSINLVMLTIPQVGVVIFHVSHLYISGPSHISGADEARHFKFGLQIERKEYWHYTCLSFAAWGCI